MDCLIYDKVNFELVLDALVRGKFIVKYKVGSDYFGYIQTFNKHQHLNAKELDSVIPAPVGHKKRVTAPDQAGESTLPSGYRADACTCISE